MDYTSPTREFGTKRLEARLISQLKGLLPLEAKGLNWQHQTPTGLKLLELHQVLSTG